MMKIIGLAGKARAGKDAVAQFALEWCEENGINAERLAFADPLKVSVAACFDVPPSAAIAFCDWLKRSGVFVDAESLEGANSLPASVTAGVSNLKGRRVTGRGFLQRYGTEAHRNVFGTDFWVDATMKPLDARFRELRAPDVVFITDCRFPNEAAAVNERSGEVWEVVRPDNTSLKDGLEAHSSEVGLPDGAIEFRINNDGSLEDLRTLVRSVCAHNLEGVA